jgi:hypothetical protein
LGDRLKSCCKKYHTILAKVIKEAKKLHYYKLINKLENKIQTIWMIIKKETAKNQGMDNITDIIKSVNTLVMICKSPVHTLNLCFACIISVFKSKTELN